jgi:hypothetical protein
VKIPVWSYCLGAVLGVIQIDVLGGLIEMDE